MACVVFCVVTALSESFLWGKKTLTYVICQLSSLQCTSCLSFCGPGKVNLQCQPLAQGKCLTRRRIAVRKFCLAPKEGLVCHEGEVCILIYIFMKGGQLVFSVCNSCLGSHHYVPLVYSVGWHWVFLRALKTSSVLPLHSLPRVWAVTDTWYFFSWGMRQYMLALLHELREVDSIFIFLIHV